MLSAGHIILRGWCENPNYSSDSRSLPLNQKSQAPQKTRMKQQENHAKKASKKDNQIVVWFEVDDTGCGMKLKT